MAKNLDIDVKVQGDTLIIREGKAPDLVVKNNVSIEGDIKSPLEYYKKRTPDPGICVLTCDVDFGKLNLRIGEDYHPTMVQIEGKIQMDSTLAHLGINSSQKYSPNALANLIKMNRALFQADTEPTYMVLFSKLKSFNAKINRQYSDENDDRGNTKYLIETELETDVPQYFTIEWPVIKNGPKAIFKVDIQAEVRDKAVSFFLHSVELEEIRKEQTEQLMKGQIDGFNDEVVIIYK